jgi:guanylate kinase
MTTAGNDKGLLVVVSAPSGGGKGTILGRAFRHDPRLAHAVSATTRPRRPNEVDGKHYHFVDRETFERWIDEGRFAEWAEVHGQLYGTLYSELDRLCGQGRDVVVELDVQGMRSLRRLRPDAATVFIEPPSLEVLEQRLRKRGDLSEEALRLRLENAKAEMAAKNEYDCRILNDDLDRAVAEFEAFVGRARNCAR